MQPYAKKLHTFLRTPAWFFSQPEDSGGHVRAHDYKCEFGSMFKTGKYCLLCVLLTHASIADTEEEKEVFKNDHGAMLEHAKTNENKLMMVS